MYEYLTGKIVQLTPTYVVLDNYGIGYQLQCTLNTYSALQHGMDVTLYTHLIVREDAHLLYGFSKKEERETFRLLISVSGIGPNTARVILSSLTPSELTQAIVSGNVSILKKAKGIGLKTAERVIVDLRDKISKATGESNILTAKDNTKREEALSALITLGFTKNASEKALDKVLSEIPGEPVDIIIKQTLKYL